MTFTDHRKCVNKIHMHNEIASTKVTHAGRAYAAIHAREHRATADDTRDLGNWSHSGSYKTYDRTLPLDGMIAAASFNAKKQSSYVIARDNLGTLLHFIWRVFILINTCRATAISATATFSVGRSRRIGPSGETPVHWQIWRRLCP